MQQWQRDQLDYIKRAERRADHARQRRDALSPAGFCHPPQAKRTKCACGEVVTLGRMGQNAQCQNCGRIHIKAPGSAFAKTSCPWKREGGRQGCPGVAKLRLPGRKNSRRRRRS